MSGFSHTWCLSSRLSSGSLKILVRSHWYRRGYLPPEVEPGGYPFPKRQVPLCGNLSFQDRLTEIRSEKGHVNAPPTLDIGLPFKPVALLPQRSQPKKMELESSARKRTLHLSIEAVHAVDEDVLAPIRRQMAAQHYGVFESLFGPTYSFVPQIPFRLYYFLHNTNGTNQSSQTMHNEIPADVQPVYTGNVISAEVASSEPWIDLSSVSSDYLWTLVMSCPDEPINEAQCDSVINEYVHWIVSNLRPSKTASDPCQGDTIVPYVPPLPYVGTGLHRYVFTLYRQNKGPIDLKSVKRDKVKNLREERAFNSLDFFRTFESELTPAGLAFFQSVWDQSVRDFYRNVLNTSEPIFELEWPAPRLPPQSKFPVANSWCRSRRHPHGLPLARERYGVHSDVSFDVYLDRYRDKKDLAEELVRERLRMEGNPLNPDDPRRKRVDYPAALPMPDGMPSWWIRQETQRRLRMGRWKHLEGHDG